MKTCMHESCDRTIILARGMCATHYSYWHRAQKKYTITCAECGKTVKVSRRGATHCSVKCVSASGSRALSNRARKTQALALYVRPMHQQPKVVHVMTARRLTSGQCRVCAAWFVSFHLDVTCSPECFDIRRREQRRVEKERRRACKRGAFVSNVYRKRVFEADGYRCHLCGKKTDKTKAVPHPRSPTVDHVTPLAAGGMHEPSNCRTACFQCNAVKGDRGSGEQMLLLAL